MIRSSVSVTSIVGIEPQGPNGSYIDARKRDITIMKAFLADCWTPVFVGLNTLVFFKRRNNHSPFADVPYNNLYSPPFNGWNRLLYQKTFSDGSLFPIERETLNKELVNLYAYDSKHNIIIHKKDINKYLGGTN